jgi:hypothetical protein
MRKRDPACLSEIAALIRVHECPVRVSVLLAPPCRPPPVHSEQLRVATLELSAEQFAEQMVVAVPLPVIVERDHERI